MILKPTQFLNVHATKFKFYLLQGRTIGALTFLVLLEEGNDVSFIPTETEMILTKRRHKLLDLHGDSIDHLYIEAVMLLIQPRYTVQAVTTVF